MAALGVVEARRRLRERERAAARLEAELARARLSALRARLQPHFLFNTLQSIGMLIPRDPAAAQRIARRNARPPIGDRRDADAIEPALPAAPVQAEARALARQLAQGPTVTLGYIKKNLNLAEDATLETVLDAEALHHTRCGETADHKEASRAFVEKRKPVFKGR